MTTAEDKVTKLPFGLDRIGRRIRSARNRLEHSERAINEGRNEFALGCKEARKHFTSLSEFEAWLVATGRYDAWKKMGSPL